jgi:signal transduction histidine kinase
MAKIERQIEAHMAGTERGLVARAARLMRMSQAFDNVLDTTAYIVVCVGAVVAVLQASPSGARGIALVIAGNLAWLLLFRFFSSRALTVGQVTLVHLTMIGLTFLVLLATTLGAGFDWLLPLATVALLPLRIPLMRAVLFALLVWAGTVALLSLLELPGRPDQLMYNLTTLAPAFLFCFLFPLAVRREGIERVRAEALVTELEEAQRQLRAYASESEELAVACERNRMAREIHDTLGHYLTILAVQLETALKMEELGDARLHAELVEARRAAAECLTEVRGSVAALRPADLTTLSLPDALGRLVSEYDALDPTIEIALDVEGSTDALDLEQRLALYRCAQEALTNIRKHSEATRALLRLRVDERSVELLALDDGCGASTGADNAPGFGLLGIRERIALLGGTSSMGPEPGKGWRVQVTAPLRRDASDSEDEVKARDTGTVERGHITSGIG